jgi:hypothetical protein
MPVAYAVWEALQHSTHLVAVGVFSQKLVP